MLSPGVILLYLVVVTTTATSSHAAERVSADPHPHQQDRNSTIPTKYIGLNAQAEPVFMPLLGIGTWQYDEATAYEAVCQAFAAGYTLVDTAYGYRNQRGVGRAIRECWHWNVYFMVWYGLFGIFVRYTEYYCSVSLWYYTLYVGGLNTTMVEALHTQNLNELGLDYVDHVMIHYPSDWDHTVTGPMQRQEEWRALEGIYATRQARTIGISHYCPHHIWDNVAIATILPALNQVEYHIGSQDIDTVIETCTTLGITFMSFSPLCGPCTYEPEDSLVDGTLVTEIAKQYHHATTTRTPTDLEETETAGGGVTGSQVALRYIVQQQIPVIPKSHTLPHIRSNAQIFDFQLSSEHMAVLQSTTTPAAEAGDCEVEGLGVEGGAVLAATTTTTTTTTTASIW